MNYTFHWYPAFKLLPKMPYGSITTIEIAFLSIIFGIILGAILALAKNSNNKIIFSIANTWIEISRNTPALYQIYMAYFGLGTFGIYVGSFGALLIGITFNNSGYLAETFRGGLRAIPATQMKTGRSLGMNFFQSFIYLLDFTYKHNPNLVNSISEPIFENYTDRLVLANHSLKQLNIISDNRFSGKYACVSNLLNNCVLKDK